MPQLGETVTEGTVVRWLKAVGETIDVDEAVLEISTDKVDSEIPAAVAGVLSEVLVREGETVRVGTVLCRLDSDVHHDETEERQDDRGWREALVGHQSRLGRPSPVIARRTTASHRVSGPPTDELLGGGPGFAEHSAVLDRIEFTSARHRTASNLERSVRETVHTLTSTTVDYSSIERARAAAERLTALPFVAYAVCRTLEHFPRLNASVDRSGTREQLVVWKPVNLGVAVDVENEGLFVPVIHEADAMTVLELAAAIQSAARAVRTHGIEPDGLARGTFTITNAGVFGTNVTTPIINPGQVAILSTDGVSMCPAAVPDGEGWALGIRPQGNLSLSFDHRAIDGAYASAFLAALRDTMESTDWTTNIEGTR